MPPTPELRTYLRRVRDVANDPDKARDVLHDINAILSVDNWSVGMLEDITAILRAAGIPADPEPPAYHAH